MEFKFTGSELAVYTGENSSYKIKIDNGKWIKVEGKTNELNPSYINLNLKNKEHKVVIQALNDNTSFEMIGVNGEISDRNIYSQSFIELYKIIGSIAISISLVYIALFLYNKFPSLKNNVKNLLNKIKEKL